MDRMSHALDYFKNGFSCSQAVLTAFSESFGLDRETALRISQAFGGGMARMSKTCGAVTGAFMVIGLKYSAVTAEDSEAKEITYEKVREFVKRFQSSHDSIECRELLGLDLNNPEELLEAEKLYPEDWIRDSIKEAALNNKRNIKYILKILENWTAEGKGVGTYQRHTKKADPDKYVKGRYGHMVRR